MKHVIALLLALIPCIALADDIVPDSTVNGIGPNGLRLIINSFTVNSQTLYIQGIPQGGPFARPAQLVYTVQNVSGRPLSLGLQGNRVSVGICHEVTNAGGLSVFAANGIIQLQNLPSYRARALQMIADHGMLSGTLEFNGENCRPSDMRGVNSVPVNMTFIVDAGDQLLTVPLYTEARPTIHGD